MSVCLCVSSFFFETLIIEIVLQNVVGDLLPEWFLLVIFRFCNTCYDEWASWLQRIDLKSPMSWSGKAPYVGSEHGGRCLILPFPQLSWGMWGLWEIKRMSSKLWQEHSNNVETVSDQDTFLSSFQTDTPHRNSSRALRWSTWKHQ